MKRGLVLGAVAVCVVGFFGLIALGCASAPKPQPQADRIDTSQWTPEQARAFRCAWEEMMVAPEHRGGECGR